MRSSKFWGLPAVYCIIPVSHIVMKNNMICSNMLFWAILTVTTIMPFLGNLLLCVRFYIKEPSNQTSFFIFKCDLKNWIETKKLLKYFLSTQGLMCLFGNSLSLFSDITLIYLLLSFPLFIIMQSFWPRVEVVGCCPTVDDPDGVQCSCIICICRHKCHEQTGWREPRCKPARFYTTPTFHL